MEHPHTHKTLLHCNKNQMINYTKKQVTDSNVVPRVINGMNVYHIKGLGEYTNDDILDDNCTSTEIKFDENVDKIIRFAWDNTNLPAK